MSATAGRGRNILSACLSMLFGLVAALLLAEVLVRAFFNEPIQPRFVIDAGYGVRANQANVETRHFVPGDYKVTINTNSAGMRGTREYSIEKADGIKRVLLLGDSFPFGYGVEDNEVVSAVLEDMMNGQANGSSIYQVLNLSVSGFGQAEELVTYHEAGRTYDADSIVFFYYDNDIGNNAVSGLYELSDDGGGAERTGSSYLPAVKTREMLYSIAPMRWLFTYSAAWNFVRNKLSYVVQKSLLRKQGLEKFDEQNPEAVELTSALLKQFVADVHHDGAEAIIVIIPARPKITSNFPLTQTEVARMGVVLIDGREFLTAGDYYQRDSHWRPSGHRKVAKRLAATLTQETMGLNSSK